MPTLREFIEQREREIREQLKLLRQELQELRRVRMALEEGDARKSTRKHMTIKEKILHVLSKMKSASSNQILIAIKQEFGEEIARQSLSPQLSRLRHEGRLEFRDGRWYIKESEPASAGSDDKNGVGMVQEPGLTSETPEGSIPSNSSSHQAKVFPPPWLDDDHH